MNNNLLELGGSVDLIATAICDFDTPTKHYKKGEIVLNLNNVYLQSIYRNKQGNINVVQPQLKYSEYFLDTLNFQMVPLNNQIYSLFSKVDTEVHEFTIQEDVMCMQNGLLIPLCSKGSPIEDSIIIENVDTFTVVSKNNVSILNSSDFKIGEKYKVSYKYEKDGNYFELGSSDLNIPYLSLQISFRGNEDKGTVNGFLLIEKAHIMFTPILNFVKNGVTYCSLVMTVIDSNYKPRLVI